jgi:hypothetical protein
MPAVQVRHRRVRRLAELVHDPDLKRQRLRVAQGYCDLAMSAGVQAHADDYLDAEKSD